MVSIKSAFIINIYYHRAFYIVTLILHAKVCADCRLSAGFRPIELINPSCNEFSSEHIVKLWTIQSKSIELACNVYILKGFRMSLLYFIQN